MRLHRDRGGAINILADAVIDRGRFLAIVVICGTLLMAVFVPEVERDPSLKSVLVTTSDAYSEYKQFTDIFGKDDFLVVMIKTPLGVDDPRFLKILRSATDDLIASEKIAEVLSLSNLKMFQERGKLLGNYPILKTESGVLRLPESAELDVMREAVPLMDLMLSRDLRTAGILVRVHDQWKYDSQSIAQLVGIIKNAIQEKSPPGTEVRIIGTPVLGQAISKYSERTALLLGILCTLICTVVTVYVFRTITVSAVTMLTLGMSLVWLPGLMAVLKIPLNAATSMSFGLILITNLEVVIHVVVRYRQFYGWAQDRVLAMKETVRYLARPIMICSGTTAVGFGACMVTSIPMVFEFGLIMSLGIILSFCLLMIVTPNLVILTNACDARPPTNPTTSDILSRLLISLEGSISRHYRLFTILGLIMAAVMFAGTPFVRTDPQLLRQLSDSSPEVKDVETVEKSLTSVHYLQLMLTAEPDAFKNPALWAKVDELEEKLDKLPEVVATESLLSIMAYLHKVTGGKESNPRDLFTNPALVPQLLFLAMMSPEGKRACRQYLDEDFQRLRISVRIKNSRSIPIGETIERVRSMAESVMAGSCRVTVTGELAVIAENGVDLIESEIYSLFIAAAIITVLMVLQMGSIPFGLICLIPSIPPVAAVFGLMGWFGIPLDGVTIFAATVATGLAVDNTIHYMAQMQREMRQNPDLDVETCVFQAYRLASKAMASWGLVTVFGFLAMLATPFKAANNFGILVATAVFMGMVGDLVLMQSMILTFPWMRRLIKKLSRSGWHSSLVTDSRQIDRRSR